ncbi:hypothetical protein LGR54_24990 [Ancylobacter sp. Lp-2]|uniref:hypothetical protein n=1 Tax=Ancylobacter sp. Lp-2 TaxID=2881339 RepID=UPI001E45FDB2|nr:hypothetical protein [Ancylobacter sp. Lp-2]MCB4771871.1 hypothetical protein [Ancylobacter sp. Lp-2]
MVLILPKRGPYFLGGLPGGRSPVAFRKSLARIYITGATPLGDRAAFTLADQAKALLGMKNTEHNT